MEDRKAKVMRGVIECVSESELETLLSSKEKPRAYVGFEPSGLLHAGSLVPMLKTRDLVNAGFQVTILLADWHGYINDKLKGDWDNLRAGVEYQKQMFSVFSPGVEFKTASELVSEKGYWEMVLRVSKSSSLKRMRRALSIMGRNEEDGDRDMSKFFYPAMQATDIYALDVDLALGGMDQRHAHMLARDAAEKLKISKPVALHTPLLGSLSGPGRMDTDSKMSKSNPSGALLIHDTKKILTKKLSKAYCPPERAANPVLDLWEYLLAPGLGKIVIERPEKFGGIWSLNLIVILKIRMFQEIYIPLI
jgi:tyrosyl-tRNA synthetase